MLDRLERERFRFRFQIVRVKVKWDYGQTTKSNYHQAKIES
jgi:hypothetical protein